MIIDYYPNEPLYFKGALKGHSMPTFAPEGPKVAVVFKTCQNLLPMRNRIYSQCHAIKNQSLDPMPPTICSQHAANVSLHFHKLSRSFLKYVSSRCSMFDVQCRAHQVCLVQRAWWVPLMSKRHQMLKPHLPLLCHGSRRFSFRPSNGTFAHSSSLESCWQSCLRNLPGSIFRNPRPAQHHLL